jgi:SAM-dependent methyltransferase
MDATPPSIQPLKAALRSTWMAGDFGVVARTIASNAESFINSLPISAGEKVLDVATGTGNLAVPLARKGAIVTGVDIAPNLLAQARERAAAENLSITFDEGDAEQLPYNDAAFQAVVTMFGAQFAPRPELVASECARVLAPGGLLAMANWDPASFTAQMFRATAKHVPPPAGVPAPILWGDEATLRERLAPFFTDVHTQIVPILFDLPTDPAGVVAFFRKNFGPTLVAFSRLDEAGQAALNADMVALWSSANTAPDPTSRTLVTNQFLRVTARRL